MSHHVAERVEVEGLWNARRAACEVGDYKTNELKQRVSTVLHNQRHSEER